MRLSEWRASSPSKEAGGAKVAAVVDPVLRALGTDQDPQCWVAWGDEPAVRYTIFVPTVAGLVTSFVRVNVPGEGPRASAKLIRWSRVQLGELAIETQAEHRLLSFQVEQHVLKGADQKADRIARFALELMASVDGRVLPPEAPTKRRPAGKTAAGRRAPAAKPGRPAAASSRSPKAAAAEPRTRRTSSPG
jgi:hypothetical protein